MAGGTFGGGNGTVTSPYLIEDGLDLRQITNGNHGTSPYFELTNDIDFSQLDLLSPTGTFSGVLDGKNFSVFNVSLSQNSSWGGFIGSLRGTIKNIKFKDISVVNTANGSTYYTGCVVGELKAGVLENVHVTNGYVKCAYNTGGLAGIVYDGGIVKNCSFNGIVEGIGGLNVGGLIGNMSNGTVKYCHSSGTISNTQNNVGGLVGGNPANSGNFTAFIENCYSTCDVNGSRYGVGGLIGLAQSSKITNCYATGNIKGESQVGGIVGTLYIAYSLVENCFALNNKVYRKNGSTSTSFGDIYGLSTGTVTYPPVNCHSLDTLEFIQE